MLLVLFVQNSSPRLLINSIAKTTQTKACRFLSRLSQELQKLFLYDLFTLQTLTFDFINHFA